MDKRYEYKSAIHLTLLLIGAIVFGIAMPIATGMMIKLAFFRDGAFTMETADAWTTFQWIVAIVLLILAITFEVYSVIIIVNVTKEFVRRRKVKIGGIYESSIIQSQDYEY